MSTWSSCLSFISLSINFSGINWSFWIIYLKIFILLLSVNHFRFHCSHISVDKSNFFQIWEMLLVFLEKTRFDQIFWVWNLIILQYLFQYLLLWEKHTKLIYHFYQEPTTISEQLKSACLQVLYKWRKWENLIFSLPGVEFFSILVFFFAFADFCRTCIIMEHRN